MFYSMLPSDLTVDPMPPEEINLAAMAETSAKSPDYRVLRRLMPRTEFASSRGASDQDRHLARRRNDRP